MESRLDRLHGRARANPALQRLAVICRISLALAFVPTGSVKVLGERFTSLGLDSPVGFFFEALYRAGAYWNFVGWSQVVAGVLVLIPATATLGAVAAFPIALNIFVITVALDFTGTPVITAGLLLASLFLLCWDYDRLKAIVFAPASPHGRPALASVGTVERAGYVIGTLSGLGVLGWTRGLVPASALRPLFGIGLFAVLLVAVGWVRALRPARADARAA